METVVILFFAFAVMFAVIAAFKSSSSHDEPLIISGKSTSNSNYSERKSTTTSSSSSNSNVRKTSVLDKVNITEEITPNIEITDEIKERAQEMKTNRIIQVQYDLKGLYYRPEEAKEKIVEWPLNRPITLIREPDNQQDRFAVKVCCDEQHVGYIPRDYSRNCSFRLNDLITCKITRRLLNRYKTEVVLTAWYYDKGYDVDGDNIVYSEIIDYFQIACDLKLEEKYEEAADIFLKSYKMNAFKNRLRCLKSAMACLRSGKNYKREMEIIAIALEVEDLTQKQKEELLIRKTRAEELLKKQEIKKNALSGAK